MKLIYKIEQDFTSPALIVESQDIETLKKTWELIFPSEDRYEEMWELYEGFYYEK